MKSIFEEKSKAGIGGRNGIGFATDYSFPKGSDLRIHRVESHSLNPPMVSADSRSSLHNLCVWGELRSFPRRCCSAKLNMKKPEKIKFELNDYHKCRDWLQRRYNYDERNYANCTLTASEDDTPYQDFWHFVIDMGNPHNGSILWMHNEWRENAEEWQVEILDRYLDHFGEGEGENRYARFWVEW